MLLNLQDYGFKNQFVDTDMKYWHEKYPFTFGIIFMIVWGALDVVDARWFIPRRYNNDPTPWVIDKDKKDVNIQGHGPRIPN